MSLREGKCVVMVGGKMSCTQAFNGVNQKMYEIMGDIRTKLLSKFDDFGAFALRIEKSGVNYFRDKFEDYIASLNETIKLYGEETVFECFMELSRQNHDMLLVFYYLMAYKCFSLDLILRYSIHEWVCDDTLLIHWLAQNVELSMPDNSHLWYIKDNYGNTTAHYAAMNGLLNVPHESGLWYIKNNSGMTPAHYAAKHGFLKEVNSPLWYISGYNKVTPAHLACKEHCFFPPSSDIWWLADVQQQTPAHYAAKEGKLSVPYECIDIWGVQDVNGNTPAHFCANLGVFFAPFDSPLWLIENREGKTPAEIGRCFSEVLRRLPDDRLVDLYYKYQKKLSTIVSNEADIPNMWVQVLLKLYALTNDEDLLNLLYVVVRKTTNNKSMEFTGELDDKKHVYSYLLGTHTLMQSVKKNSVHVYLYLIAGWYFSNLYDFFSYRIDSRTGQTVAHFIVQYVGLEDFIRNLVDNENEHRELLKRIYEIEDYNGLRVLDEKLYY